MVLCLLALPIFAILGLFSLKYRKLTKESLDCMFRTVTLRKCRSGLDERIKSDVTGKLMKVSPRIARGFYKNYKLISWIIILLFVWATYISAIGIYNYYAYGNCNGENSSEFCILNPTGTGEAHIRDLAEQYGVDADKLIKCFEENSNLGENECLTYCLDKI